MNSIKSYLKPHRLTMAIGFTVKFFGTLMDLLIPWILAYTIDVVIPKESTRQVFIMGGAMIFCALIALAANIYANRNAAKVSRQTIEKIRYDLYSKMTHLSTKQTEEMTLPSLISRLTADSYHVHHMLSMMQRLGVRAPILLIGGIIITLTLDVALALVLIFTLPFIAILVYRVSKKGIPLYQILQQKVDTLVRTIRENISGIRVIKALSKTDYEKKRFDQVNEDVVSTEKRVGRTMAITNPLMNLMLNLGLTLVVVVGAYRVNSGLSQTGSIIAFLTYFTLILNAMLSITRIFILYSKGTASFSRIQEVLNLPEDLLVLPEDIIPSEYHLEVKNLMFSYHKKTPDLSEISFSLKKGETLGIIGATGSGKSSLIKLLMRFYDPDAGEIRINGQNIKSMPREKLHTQFGVVLQNDVLFADTIEENIAFGRDIDLEDIAFSAKMAQAGEFIDTLSHGLNHVLDVKGANLSGGQKQRILISRALALEPEILILDDASSALDYHTDASLRKSLREHFKDTTTLIVAQRISSIMHADQILVLEEGKISGLGSHDFLLKTCPIYQSIYSIQMGGENNEKKDLSIA